MPDCVEGSKTGQRGESIRPTGGEEGRTNGAWVQGCATERTSEGIRAAIRALPTDGRDADNLQGTGSAGGAPAGPAQPPPPIWQLAEVVERTQAAGRCGSDAACMSLRTSMAWDFTPSLM